MTRQFTTLASLTLLALSSFSVFNLPAANADWDSSSLKWASDMNLGPVQFTSPYVIAAWSAARAEEVKNFSIHDLFIPDNRFKDGGFEVAMELQKSKKDILKAPLLIALPGIFNSHNGSTSKRMALFYSKRGYHVVIPSNPWSKDYIQHQPTSTPGSLPAEADVMLSMIDTAIDKIGRDHISAVQLVGESYGALLAAVVYQKDQIRAQPVIDGNLTLFSPPLDMNIAIANLDAGYERTQQLYGQSCSGKKAFLEIIGSLVSDSAEGKMNARVQECSEPLVFNSFHKSLVHSLEMLQTIRNIQVIPTEKFARANWEKNFRFADVVKTFEPENLPDLTDGTVSLTYWLQKMPPNSLAKVRIMTASDDFLNTGISWPVNNGVINKTDFIELPWGGHLGYESISEFQKFLDIAF